MRLRPMRHRDVEDHLRSLGTIDGFVGATAGATLRVRAIQLLADRTELTPLELADLDPTPAIRRANHGRIHQLEHGPLAERMRNDLRPAALFKDEPLEEVRRANHPTMAEREAQMVSTGLPEKPLIGDAMPAATSGELTTITGAF
jgi:hypothetical protein